MIQYQLVFVVISMFLCPFHIYHHHLFISQWDIIMVIIKPARKSLYSFYSFVHAIKILPTLMQKLIFMNYCSARIFFTLHLSYNNLFKKKEKEKEKKTWLVFQSRNKICANTKSIHQLTLTKLSSHNTHGKVLLPRFNSSCPVCDNKTQLFDWYKLNFELNWDNKNKRNK